MKKYNLRIIVHIGYTDAGESDPAKVIDYELKCRENIGAIRAMLKRIIAVEKRYANVPDVKILAELMDDKKRPVSIFDGRF